MKRFFIFIFIAVIFSGFAAEVLKCSVCNRRISGEYIKNKDGAAFCSEKCLAKVSPKCQSCKKPCVKGFITFMEKTYCSKECLQLDNRCDICKKGAERYLCFTSPGGRNMMICNSCANRQKCYSCCIPYPSRQLPDGRFLCVECEKTVITDFNEIMKIFKSVRRDMYRYYGYDANHKIDLKLVTPDELAKATPSIPKSPNSRQLAAMLYRYEMREITTSNGQKSYQMGATHCSALFLTYVPRELLIDSIAHELTHDYLRHKAGMIPVLKIEEGFCEAIAADYNTKRNQAALNIRKANNPDPIYGDGYREMSKMLKKDGFPKTVKYLRSIAKPMLNQMRNR